MYNKIKNPETNRWVNIDSKLGKKILFQYATNYTNNTYYGGNFFHKDAPHVQSATPVQQAQVVQVEHPKKSMFSSMKMPSMNNMSGKSFFTNYIVEGNSKWLFRIHTNAPNAISTSLIFKINQDGTVHRVGTKTATKPCICKVPSCGQPMTVANKATSVILGPRPVWYGTATLHFSGMMGPSLAYYYHEEGLKAFGGYCM